MASAENEIPTEMQDRGKWYGDAADYWKVRDRFLYIQLLGKVTLEGQYCKLPLISL